ncbi:AraC family transcriptional regulator [Streptomyces olindensis]|uniref:helix-turn-helix transcriptional regulator n=1 Tax=Streptomyces olindensis TaxID=358823 RepID=UPI003693B043
MVRSRRAGAVRDQESGSEIRGQDGQPPCAAVDSANSAKVRGGRPRARRTPSETYASLPSRSGSRTSAKAWASARGSPCRTPGGAEQATGPARTCGTPADGAPVLLSGAFERRGELSERLVRALPPVLVVPGEDSPHPAVRLVAQEITRERPGQQLVLDRLLDLMLVSALRGWFDDPDADAPAWCRALDDPVVGAALRLLHAAPAHPWTVADLAAGAGVSRAALARRFTALVGEPPMAYLAGWRIALAADLLRQTDHTVGTIARKVGYSNAFALSVAFKRLRGTRPSDHRAAGPGPSAG